MADKVNTEHPDYYAIKERYKLVDAILDNDAKCYIRQPCGKSKVNYYNDDGTLYSCHFEMTPEDAARNQAYKDNAVLTNFTKLTLNGLTRLIFRKPPKVELPKELQYMLTDCTGTGIDLYQFSQTGIKQLIRRGRYFVIPDYNAETKEVYFIPYAAPSVINWKTRRVNGKVQPWLITLTEWIIVNDDKDKFSQTLQVQYRVLTLDENDRYYQEIYNQKLELVDYVIPLDYNGKQYVGIPHQFFGSENNDWEVDEIPLYPMAELNLAHYRDSADNQEAVFLCGQPYVVVSVGDSSVEDFLAANPEGVYFGSRKCLLLPLNGRAEILQAQPNTMVRQAMIDILEEAARTGATFIDPSGGRETALGVRTRAGAQASPLTVLTYNFTSGINALIRLACIAMGIPNAKFTYKLNDVFYDDVPDAAVLGQMLVGVEKGAISVKDVTEYGKLTGFIDEERTDEEIASDIAKQQKLLTVNSSNGTTSKP